MKELKQMLENPFDTIETKENFQEKCEQIAKDLFSKYCIKCKEKEFYFAEIEFYYWQKGKWDEKWNQVTYARDGCEAGELFFHPSGVDICFDSTFDEKNGCKNPKFGGILIRSIMDECGKVVAGPWNSMMAILNACKGGSMPHLFGATKRQHTPTVMSTYRQLGEVDMVEEEKNPLHLCFYDVAIPKDNWNFEKKSFNKTEAKEETTKTYYNKTRFKYDNN